MVKPYADALSVKVIEISKAVKSLTDVHLTITIAKNPGEVTIDDCEAFHRAVLPVLELEYGREALSMEVTTPGIQRIFKDTYEFEVFTGKFCRVYSSIHSSWIEGTISSYENNKVTLNDYLVVDSNEKGESITLELGQISKAKLEYKWETKEDKIKKNIEKQKNTRRENK